MTDTADRQQDFGANSWLVEEMYEQYTADPTSVSDAWREFFSDYRSIMSTSNGAITTPAPTAPATPAAAASNGAATTATPAPSVAANGSSASGASSAPAPAVAASVTPEPIRGVGATIVTNMERSLT
ncbi:MAG: 2-oxoglutarate dehydrogenase E1 subunit family protein, partial [Actinomycetota bacterium]